MRHDGQSGRARLAITIGLVLVIGLGGAILLPRLLHKASRDGPAADAARVCVEVPPGGLVRAGTIRIAAGYDDRPDVFIERDFAAGADADTVRTALGTDMTAAGVGRDNPWEDAWGHGACTFLRPAAEVGGDPGLTGAILSLGLSADPRETFRVEIGCEAKGPVPATPGWRIRFTLNARVAIGPDPEPPLGAESQVETAWGDVASVREALFEGLRAAGWPVAVSARNTIIVSALPDDRNMVAALARIAYVRDDGATQTPPSTYHWTLRAMP